MHVNKSVSLDMKALNIIDGVMIDKGLPFSTVVNNIIMQWRTYENSLQAEYKKIGGYKPYEKPEVIKE